MARARAVVLLGFWSCAIAVLVPPLIVLAVATKNENFLYKPVRFFVRIGMRLAGVRVKVSGIEHLDPRRTYVFTPNHQSIIEVPLVVTYLPVNAAFLAKKELFRFPIFGHGMRTIKVVPVDRRDRQAALKSTFQAVDNLRKGKSYIVYPEGTRSPDGRLLPFKKGAFLMAIEAGVPVVPITVSGGAAVMPKGKAAIFPGTVHVAVHQPIDTHGYSKGQVQDLIEKTRTAIASVLSEREQGAAESRSTGI